MVDSGFIDKKKSGYYVHDWEDKYSQLDKYRKMNVHKDKKNTDKEKRWMNLIRSIKIFKRSYILKLKMRLSNVTCYNGVTTHNITK